MSKFVTESGIEQLIAITKGELNTKADSSHTHEIDDINGLKTALDGKADATHTHEISDVTNLQTILDSKVSSSQVLSITAISQAEYDALETKDASTLYLITG